MENYKVRQLKRLSFDEIKDLFETTMRRANTFVPMETKIRRGVPELVAGSSQAVVTESTEAGGTKRAAEEELGQQSSKKQKSDELSQEEIHQLMIIVPEERMNIEALQTKYPIIDWEVYTEDSRICSFHGLRSEDPNQHLKDFLKLVDSLDLDGENRERTRLCLFQFSFRDQASNWLERLLAGSITTWEDLTKRFLAQFFLPGRTAKLLNDILMFQQHHGESLSEAWTSFKDLQQKVPHHGIDLCWNDPRDFAKPVKAIVLPQDVQCTSDRRLIELENQVQLLMEAHLAPTQPTQVNKVTTSCEIYSGPHDTQYCMEDPEQAFVEYASSRTDEAGGKWVYFKPEQNNLVTP
ncbi:MAK10-like protein [Tanacetum coccineum]